MMSSKLKKGAAYGITLGLVLQTVACGTILYPERKGQTGGNLDVGVVALDALGLLFFFVPGVIAFIVDFHNGTIYEPGGASAQLTEEELHRITDANGKVNREELQRVLQEKQILSGSYDANAWSVERLDSHAQIQARLAPYAVTYARNEYSQ